MRRSCAEGTWSAAAPPSELATIAAPVLSDNAQNTVENRWLLNNFHLWETGNFDGLIEGRLQPQYQTSKIKLPNRSDNSN